MPDPPPLVCGLVAWRAHILPVIALGQRLNCQDPPVDRCTLVVVEVEGDLIALAVDEALHLAEAVGADGRAVQILDVGRMLDGS